MSLKKMFVNLLVLITIFNHTIFVYSQQANEITSNTTFEHSLSSGNLSEATNETLKLPLEEITTSGTISKMLPASVLAKSPKAVITSSPRLNETFSTDLLQSMPKSCSQMNRRKLDEQPIQTPLSRLKKCCPIGESLYHGEEGGKKYCDAEVHQFNVELVNAVLFDNCIEDLEKEIELDVEAGNPCNVKASGDQMFVLQDGSLLIMDEFGNDSYEISYDYCLDVDYISGDLQAIVCVTSIDSHISRGQTILFAVFMLISIPCLIIVIYIHFRIKALRTVHGLSLGVLSSCLAVGFSGHIYAQIMEDHSSKIGYFVQFFMLAYFFWMVMLCSNICITVWYYLPRYVTITRLIRYGRIASFSCFAFGVPLILVLITYHKKIPGMPSYFYQGWSESVQSSQRYFIPPVSCCIGASFALLVAAYFGFRQLDLIDKVRGGIQYQAIIGNNLNDDSNIPTLDQEFLRETRKDAQCIAILLLIMSITFMLEVITFYSPGTGDSQAFMEIMNGLQGVFILMIFIVARERRSIIVRWWHDRGSHEVTPVIVPVGSSQLPRGANVEMSDMKSETNDNKV